MDFGSRGRYPEGEVGFKNVGFGTVGFGAGTPVTGFGCEKDAAGVEC